MCWMKKNSCSCLSLEFQKSRSSDLKLRGTRDFSYLIGATFSDPKTSSLGRRLRGQKGLTPLAKRSSKSNLSFVLSVRLILIYILPLIFHFIETSRKTSLSTLTADYTKPVNYFKYTVINNIWKNRRINLFTRTYKVWKIQSEEYWAGPTYSIDGKRCPAHPFGIKLSVEIAKFKF